MNNQMFELFCIEMRWYNMGGIPYSQKVVMEKPKRNGQVHCEVSDDCSLNDYSIKDQCV